MQAWNTMKAPQFYTPDMFTAQAFVDNLPTRCACCDKPSDGVIYLPREEAIKRAHLAPNPRNLCRFLLFDVDRPGAIYAADDAGLPQPTWIAENRRNGHAHLGYLLAAPVARSNAARLKPLQALARIEHGMRRALRADVGYASFLTKTPFHTQWNTTGGAVPAFDFQYLREFLPAQLPLPVRATEAAGLGRNCLLFEKMRRWSYRARLEYSDFLLWQDGCIEHCAAMNNFPAPLPLQEVRSIGRSVARWTWQRITEKAFSEIQRHRQKSIAQRRANATAEAIRAQLALPLEQSAAQIGEAIGKTARTVRAYQAQSRADYLAEKLERRHLAAALRMNGLSYREIGAIMECSEGAARLLVHRAAI